MSDAVETGMKAAQVMSGWSDKALFLAALLTLVGGALFAIRYLAKKGDEKDEMLRGLFQEANTGRIEVAKALSANTDVLCETRDQLRECTEFFKRVKHH